MTPIEARYFDRSFFIDETPVEANGFDRGFLLYLI